MHDAQVGFIQIKRSTKQIYYDEEELSGLLNLVGTIKSYSRGDTAFSIKYDLTVRNLNPHFFF